MPPSQPLAQPTSRRLLIFQETRNPQNTAETVYLPVNKLGLPICGDGPELPSILELPLRILRVFTDIFNQPKYKGWYVCFACFSFSFHLDYSVVGLSVLIIHRAVLSAGPYHDTSEEGKFYAVVLEQMQQVSVQGLQPDNMIQSTP
jgi:hypothetical protein